MAEAHLSLTVDRDALLPALSRADKIVNPKSPVPVLTHVLLSTSADSLTVTGTNLDIQAETRVRADVSDIGAVTAPARLLHDFVKKLPKGSTIRLTAEGAGRLSIAAGRSRLQLPSLPPEDFPEYGSLAGGGSFTHNIEMAGSILASVLNRGKFAISTEETRYFLNGTYMHVASVDDVPTLRLVSTDGHRLVRIDTPSASGLAFDMPGIIVPRQAVPEFAALADDAGSTLVMLDVSDRLIRLSAGETTIVSKLVDGTFPDYHRVIPQDFAREVRVPTLALIEALDRVATLSGEKTRGVKLDIEADRIAITLRDINGGAEAHDELDAELTGQPLRIGFNGRYLAEILAHVGSDTVRLRLGADAGAPIVIGDKFAEALFVLMPLRITDA